MAVPELPPTSAETSRWVRRLAYNLAWLGWGWKRAPRPIRVIVWTITLMLVAAITALGAHLGVPPTPQVQDLVETVVHSGEQSLTPAHDAGISNIKTTTH